MRRTWLTMMLLLGLSNMALAADDQDGWSFVTRLETKGTACSVGISRGELEATAVGPRALAVAADGTIAVADAVGRRVVRVAREGFCLAPVFEGRQPADIAFDAAGQMHVLDCQTRTVHVAGKEGRTFPLDDGAECPNLAMDDHGNPVAVYGQTGRGLAQEAPFKMGVPDAHAPLHHFVRLTQDNTAILISVPWGQEASARNEVARARIRPDQGQRLQSVVFLGTDRDDRRYVAIDVRQEGNTRNAPIASRQIQVFDPSGRLVASKNAPAMRGPVWPQQVLAVDPEGGVIVLNNLEGGAMLWRWGLARKGGSR